MTDINKVILVARLTRDVEVKYTSGGTSIGNFAVAVNRSVKKNDQWTDETSFFEVTVFGKIVENIKPYLIKGQQVAIDGYLKQDRWEKEGEKYSKIGIVAESLQLVGGKGEKQNPNAPKVSPAPMEYQEDIPFNNDKVPF